MMAKHCKIISVLFMAPLLAGCDVDDPGLVRTNLPPDTEITAGPPEGMVTTPGGEILNFRIHMYWMGSDHDGSVVAYDIAINDTSEWLRTANTDSILFFFAPTGESGYLNTFYVRAVDDSGAVDLTPAERSFTAHTIVPDSRIRGVPIDGATIGRGARFQVLGLDDDGSEFNYSYALDDTNRWSEWQEDSAFVFATDDVPGSLGLLEPGDHVLYARVRDGGQAVDPSPDSISFVVQDDFAPNTTITAAKYNGLPLYWDGSVFSMPDTITDLALQWNVSVGSYYGTYYQSRYKFDDGSWSEWDDTLSVTLDSIQPGNHVFSIIAKDLAGATNTLEYNIDVLTPTFSNGIALIDENDGGLADDAAVDAFYRNVVESAGRSVDLLWSVADSGDGVTPGMLFDHSLAIWFDDETWLKRRNRDTRIIEEYLDRGGKVCLLGFQHISGIAGVELPASFQESDFAFDYLKLGEANTKSTADFAGAFPAPGLGYPSLSIDSSKIIIPSWNGNLAYVDIFTPSADVSEAETVLLFNSASSDPVFDGAATGVRYLGSDHKFIILGFPIYYIKEADAVALFEKVLTDLGE